MAKHKTKTPILDALMCKGIVWTDGIEYFGIASDGVKVTIGCILTPKDLVRLEAWLVEFSTPDKW